MTLSRTVTYAVGAEIAYSTTWHRSRPFLAHLSSIGTTTIRRSV